MNTIKQEAERVIAAADQQQTMMVMIGLPLGTDTSNDPTMSAYREGKCSRCAAPVMSTVMKETILDLTKARPVSTRAVLLCGLCLLKMKEAFNLDDSHIRGMYEMKVK
jgi:hypothetical protein